MAFNVEIQSSQSGPQTTQAQNNNNRPNNSASNDPNESATVKQERPYDYHNHEFRTNGKYCIDDPGTTAAPTNRPNRVTHGGGPQQPQIDGIEISIKCEPIEKESFEFEPEPASEFEFEFESEPKSNYYSQNTETIFETKNIFAYQACKAITRSDCHRASPPPARFEFVTTPPPTNLENSGSDQQSRVADKRQNPNTTTLFTKVTGENRKVDTKQSESRAKERFDTRSPRDHSIPICKPEDYGSNATIRTQVARFFSNPSGDYSIPTTSGVALSGKRIASIANQKRQESANNTTKHSASSIHFGQEERDEETAPRTIAIDLSLNGRHRVDRCRYVPYSSGYEWSNAAYCYS